MFRTMLTSKIHRATVTHADLLEDEQVTNVDIDNGNRLATYAIAGQHRWGVIGINGAAAHLVHPGDLVIPIAYATTDDAAARDHRPRVVFVDADNRRIDLGHDPARVPDDVAGLLSPRAVR
jgi:aspartate 1-decarboxylase